MALLRSWLTRIAALAADETGYQALEYALLLAFIVWPLVALVPYLVDMLRIYFSLVSFTVSLPFP
jgi:Flp pilus assembly pilin Flp